MILTIDFDESQNSTAFVKSLQVNTEASTSDLFFTINTVYTRVMNDFLRPNFRLKIMGRSLYQICF